MSINRFSFHLLLLLLFMVSLNNSCGNIVTFKTPSINNEQIHPNINILFLSLVNDLPLSADPLFFTSNFRSVKYMAPGEHFTMITNFDIKWITLYWSRNNAPRCAFDWVLGLKNRALRARSWR
ncbi:hypothetical protein AAHE18_19G113700 [Arachis hypogaea]